MKTWHNNFPTVLVSLKLLFSFATHRAGEYASLTCQTITLISQVSVPMFSVTAMLATMLKKKDPVKHNYTPLKEKLTDRNHSDSSIQSLICFGQRRRQENVEFFAFIRFLLLQPPFISLSIFMSNQTASLIYCWIRHASVLIVKSSGCFNGIPKLMASG